MCYECVSWISVLVVCAVSVGVLFVVCGDRCVVYI